MSEAIIRKMKIIESLYNDIIDTKDMERYSWRSFSFTGHDLSRNAQLKIQRYAEDVFQNERKARLQELRRQVKDEEAKLKVMMMKAVEEL